MGKTSEMVTNLETLIIEKVRSFNKNTSPEEISTLAELVRATDSCNRYLAVHAQEKNDLAEINYGTTLVQPAYLESIYMLMDELTKKINSTDDVDMDLLERKIDLLNGIARAAHLLTR